MGFYSRQNLQQSCVADEVYAVIKRYGNITLGDGTLTMETQKDARSILAAVVLLQEEWKIVIRTSPKNEFTLALQ